MNKRRRLPLSLPSGSKSDLAAECVFPWNGGVRWPKWQPSRVDQRFGNAFHHVAEAVAHVFNEFGMVPGSVELGVFWAAEAYELTEKEREMLESITYHLIEQLANDDATYRTPEQCFAIDVETSAVRLASDRRDRKPSERIAISDLIVHLADGRHVVREYKTGRGAQSKRARSSGQTRSLAFAAARYYELESVRMEVVHVAADGFKVDAVEFDSLELLAIECEQDALLERLIAAPMPKPGPWCAGEFCPMVAECPSTKAMLAEVERHALAIPVLHDPRTPEEAGMLRTAVQAIRKWAEDADEKWKAIASRMPLPIGGGKVVVAQERRGDDELVENDRATQLIADEITQLVIDADPVRVRESQQAAYSVKYSKASIVRGVRKALGPSPARGALKRGQTRVLDRLRAAGLVRRGAPYVVFTEVPESRLHAAVVESEVES